MAVGHRAEDERRYKRGNGGGGEGEGFDCMQPLRIQHGA